MYPIDMSIKVFLNPNKVKLQIIENERHNFRQKSVTSNGSETTKTSQNKKENIQWNFKKIIQWKAVILHGGNLLRQWISENRNSHEYMMHSQRYNEWWRCNSENEIIKWMDFVLLEEIYECLWHYRLVIRHRALLSNNFKSIFNEIPVYTTRSNWSFYTIILTLIPVEFNFCVGSKIDFQEIEK